MPSRHSTPAVDQFKRIRFIISRISNRTEPWFWAFRNRLQCFQRDFNRSLFLALQLNQIWSRESTCDCASARDRVWPIVCVRACVSDCREIFLQFAFLLFLADLVGFVDNEPTAVCLAQIAYERYRMAIIQHKTYRSIVRQWVFMCVARSVANVLESVLKRMAIERSGRGKKCSTLKVNWCTPNTIE